MEPVGVEYSSELVAGATRFAFRFEQFPIYPDDVHGGALDRWLAGQPAYDPTELDLPWWDMVRQLRASGVAVERLRVTEDQPTRYQQWIREVGQSLVEVGEVHRYVTRSVAASAEVDETAGDWWLIDGERMVVYRQADDLAVSQFVTDDQSLIGPALEAWHRLAPVAEVATYQHLPVSAALTELTSRTS